MIVRDEARIAKDAAEKLNGDKFTQNQARIDEARKAESFVAGPTSKIVPGAQWQNLMLTSEFERRLKKILPALQFVEFSTVDLAGKVAAGEWPFDKPWHHKRLMYPVRDEHGTVSLFPISLYPRECLPELSIMYHKENELPNPEYISTGKVANANSQLTYKFMASDGIAIIGWREILVKLRNTELVSNAQIEAEFGTANTAEWQQKFVGGAHDGRPW